MNMKNEWGDNPWLSFWGLIAFSILMAYAIKGMTAGERENPNPEGEASSVERASPSS